MHRVLFVLTFCMLLNVNAEPEFIDKGESTVTIDTPSGKIKGIQTNAPGSGATVYQFRKVPFAKPPVKDLRFRNPEPYGKWEGTLDATEFGASCMQSDFPFMDYYDLPNKELSEDCLFLNIYVPHTLTKDNNLPVMIWVHGGGYMMGQGMFYPSSTLSTFGDVIVVTINYRLGIFGFFSLNNEAALGNYGLWDQKMAFEWVHDNIAAFGGDPNSVTIFGESAGGFSVSLHTMISSNKGLFNRVIAQSGTGFADYAYSKYAHTYSKMTGEALGCSMSEDGTYDDFMACMREKSATEVSDAASYEKVYDPTKFNMTSLLAPVIDGVLIKDSPSKLLSDSYPEERDFFHSLDFMTGVTSHEGAILTMMLAAPQIQEKYDFNITNGIPTNVVCGLVGKGVLETIVGSTSKEAEAAVCQHYTDSSSLEKQSMRALDVLGDVMFVAPAIQAVNLHCEGGRNSNTYYYKFSKISIMSLLPPLPWFKGSAHADDLTYTFGEDSLSYLKEKIEFTKEDVITAESVMQYWSNFAKSGNPNKPTTNGNLVEWPSYDSQNQKYMDLDVQCTTHNRPSPSAAKLWIEVIPELLKTEKDKKHEEL